MIVLVKIINTIIFIESTMSILMYKYKYKLSAID